MKEVGANLGGLKRHAHLLSCVCARTRTRMLVCLWWHDPEISLHVHAHAPVAVSTEQNFILLGYLLMHD